MFDYTMGKSRSIEESLSHIFTTTVIIKVLNIGFTWLKKKHSDLRGEGRIPPGISHGKAIVKGVSLKVPICEAGITLAYF